MKKQVKILRLERTDKATIGSLLVDGRVIGNTLEEPWRDNEPNISCIPEGFYPMVLEWSPSKGRLLWTIKDVPDRFYVRIHTGNTVDDTEGCPLPGSKVGSLHGKRAVLESRLAFKLFMLSMGGKAGDRAEIEIRNIPL